MEEQATGSWVSIQEASTLRGVSPDTIRNWVKASKVMSRKRKISQGFAYEVFLVDHQAVEIVPSSSIVQPTLEPLADLIREMSNRIGQLERECGALGEKLQAAESKLLVLEAPPKKHWWKFWA